MHPYPPTNFFLYRLISKMIQMASKMAEFSQLAEELPPCVLSWSLIRRSSHSNATAPTASIKSQLVTVSHNRQYQYTRSTSLRSDCGVSGGFVCIPAFLNYWLIPQSGVAKIGPTVNWFLFYFVSRFLLSLSLPEREIGGNPFHSQSGK